MRKFYIEYKRDNQVFGEYFNSSTATKAVRELALQLGKTFNFIKLLSIKLVA